MNRNVPILECIPNFSEGRDEHKIQAVADAIRSVSGAHLLHIDASPAANRTVMTFAGEPGAVIDAAYRAIATAAEVIDMQQQEGVHPRIGATDVCPLVPIAGMSMEDADNYAQQLGEKVGTKLNIPVYMYEYSATADYRRALPDIRSGQYEKFAQKMNKAEWLPDYGPHTFNSHTGATVIGARKILVAFNISINTDDVSKAEYIAKHLRERGYTSVVDGNKKKIPGLLPKLRAIGWYMKDFEHAQVSTNLIDYTVTSPLKVWEACRQVAESIGVQLLGSELIGLMPEACLIEAGTFTYMRNGWDIPADQQLLVHKGIELLGLNAVKPFDPQVNILEYALSHAGLL